MITVITSTSTIKIAFELIGTVPAAAAQSTTWGKSLQGLVHYDGKIFGGYGDWNANSGPVIPWVYDIESDVLSSTGYSIPTENISVMKVIDGVLWAPLIDPRGGFPNNYLARYTTADGWSLINMGVPGLHLFDIAKHGPSGKLIATGSRNSPDAAVIFESDDGGDSWTLSHTGPNSTRYYSVFTETDDPDTSDLVTNTYGSWIRYDGSSWSATSAVGTWLELSTYNWRGGKLVSSGSGTVRINDTTLTWIEDYANNTIGPYTAATYWYDDLTDYLYIASAYYSAQHPNVIRRAKLSQINDSVATDFYSKSVAIASNIGSGTGPTTLASSSVALNNAIVVDGMLYTGDALGQLWRATLPTS